MSKEDKIIKDEEWKIEREGERERERGRERERERETGQAKIVSK